MDKMPATIVLPVYKVERYIKDMLDSIYNQTYRPIELIISDDNSPDRTARIIEEWRSGKDSADFMIKVIRHDKNLGQCCNINEALAYATGDMILLADHDDVWDGDKVKKQVDVLSSQPEYSAVLCDRRLIDSEGFTLVESEYKYIGYTKTTAGFEDLLEKNCRYSANTLAFRREGLSRVLPIPEDLIETDFFVLLALALAGKVFYIHEPLVNYRLHRNSLSRNYFQETSRNIIDFYRGSIAGTKRLKKVLDNDAPAILGELKRRFGVSVGRSWYDNVKIGSPVKRFIHGYLYYKKTRKLGAFLEKENRR